MNLSTILRVICSLMFFMIGVEKFMPFLDPPCSILDTIPNPIWRLLGILQIAGGILIWFPKFKKPVSIFFIGFMLFFIIYHLTQSTYDIGGALFMAVLLSLVVWDPQFMRGKAR